MTRSNLYFCNPPSQVGPQQGSFCPVSFEPIECDGVRFRSKGKLYSLIKEWRDVSLSSTLQGLPSRLPAPVGGAAL